MKASIRKILAEALKGLSQADKNSAAAATSVFQTLLKGLESGVTPAEVAAAGGAGALRGQTATTGSSQGYVPVSPGTGIAGNSGMATARTTLHLNNVRTKAEHEGGGFTLAKHPTFEQAWRGGLLVKGA